MEKRASSVNPEITNTVAGDFLVGIKKETVSKRYNGAHESATIENLFFSFDRCLAPLTDRKAIKAKGKFLYLGQEKFFLKGVTYGPFAQSTHGAPFPEKPLVAKDFAMMVELGANCVRTFTVPPEWLLDLAASHGLRILTGIPWAQHVSFLDSSSLKADIRRTVANGVKACRSHPAVFAYLVGNEIPPDIVRWYGRERVRTFVRELVEVAKDNDGGALVSYANFPSTEYLDVNCTDFLAFNVYLHSEEDFRRYLAHLHILAEDRPLILTEFGIDSLRETGQAEILSWQVHASFEMGVAGTVVFAWTDEWATGGFAIEDWAFGLVDRERSKKPAFGAVQRYYKVSLPPILPEYPKVSVIVCAYNGKRTMDNCLASLKKLNYPNYEVIVVNDGSTDGTLEIAKRYDYVRLISHENKGLSAARNTGITAATGDIIAFTDSDCVVDPDWLTYLVAKFLSSGFAAVGGPNFPPPDDSLVSSCVAVSPGGPTHVLLNDEVAEHIPGCNMAFRREALLEIGAFDPLFRAAGDDVDVCWRLQNKGYAIGFSPAAMVWHFRRNTVKDYLKQQMGYGKAEALLYFKHPYRFNLVGQPRWLGRIYGDLSSFLISRRPVIYSGVFGRGLFQTLYQPPCSFISHLPLTLEWNAAAILLLGCALLFGGYLWLGIIPFLISLVKCVVSVLEARIDPRFRGLRARLLVALLTYLGPLVRSLERYRWRIRRLREAKAIDFNVPMQKPRISLFERAFFLSYWTEEGLEKETLLHGIVNFLLPRKYLITTDQGWSGWDLEIYQGSWARAQIKIASENHGGKKRLLRVRCALRMSRLSVMTLVAYLPLAALGFVLGMPQAAALSGLVGGIHTAAIFYQKFRLGRILYNVLEIVAKRLQLLPIDKSARASTA
ncbi:MAG: glycosyltransferase [Candidatus Binatia bacterium]